MYAIINRNEKMYANGVKHGEVFKALDGYVFVLALSSTSAVKLYQEEPDKSNLGVYKVIGLGEIDDTIIDSAGNIVMKSPEDTVFCEQFEIVSEVKYKLLAFMSKVSSTKEVKEGEESSEDKGEEQQETEDLSVLGRVTASESIVAGKPVTQAKELFKGNDNGVRNAFTSFQNEETEASDSDFGIDSDDDIDDDSDCVSYNNDLEDAESEDDF